MDRAGEAVLTESVNRANLVWGSYWALLIIAPVIVCFLLFGASLKAAVFCFPILVLLCLIGEHGIRLWERLWGVE